MYLHPQVVPVAHVPIGAAHYAHLPPSIWGPAHAQYHHQPHPSTAHHPRSLHPVAQAAHHLPLHPPPTHMHPMASPHAATQLYAHPSSQAHIPTHADVHPYALHQHHVGYPYPHLGQAPPPHHIKPSLALLQHSSAPMHASYQPTSSSHLTTQQVPNETHRVEQVGDPKNSNHALPKMESGIDEKGKPLASEHRSHGAANRTLVQESVESASPRKMQSNRGNPKDNDSTRPGGSSSSPKNRAHATNGQPARKPRKPYTMTKSREVWTPEEHNRFLHALTLYDRDWKKIEAYIGTKTVLQIRSHAQKHFSKVTKYRTGEYIPPPRPKKRAVLPYPRSRSSGNKSNSNSAGTGSDSGGGSDNNARANGVVNGSVKRNGINGTSALPTLMTSSMEPTSKVSARPSTSSSLQHQSQLCPTTASSQHTPMQTSNPYYDMPGSRGSFNNQSLPRMQGLPPPKYIAGRHLPAWNSGHSYHSGPSRQPYRPYGNPGESKTPNEINKLEKISPVEKLNGIHVVNGANSLSREGTRNGNFNDAEGRDGRSRVNGGPNNSLLVLSSCVDMVSGDNRSDARGNESLKQDWAKKGAGSTQDHKNVATHKLPLEKSGGLPGAGKRDVTVKSEVGKGNGAASTTRDGGTVRGSDDGTAGFSGSDGRSGSGGSLETSEDGDNDPKSSNDGSGDDVRRGRSPSTRDSSPADGGSGESRENTPGDGSAIGKGSIANLCGVEKVGNKRGRGAEPDELVGERVKRKCSTIQGIVSGQGQDRTKG